MSMNNKRSSAEAAAALFADAKSRGKKTFL